MNTQKLLYGIAGGLIAFPFGLAVGGYMVEAEFWVSLMGIEWVAYKSAVSGVVMIGFALGISLCSQTGKAPTKEDQVDSFY
ncbi:hypothetical protein [Hydrogenophaga sp. PAMC20947]|uniref:hypothetical protein n=1 Tax=Hydrogenophaga sp. PAMC20947 TaxID=2565558 RepID=UPI00109DB600|nr:hypothetical protein [Hydrogenophaga sp. PAMC20947]QCB46277.1 hypothetical protein E5678_09735 [Hydrogenophaga sp. PAMC20947]